MRDGLVPAGNDIRCGFAWHQHEMISATASRREATALGDVTLDVMCTEVWLCAPLPRHSL
jgi:hypothetical protein